jgi:hypothetical protein
VRARRRDSPVAVARTLGVVRVAALALASVLAAGGSTGTRVTYPDDRLSVVLPPRWHVTSARINGSLIPSQFSRRRAFDFGIHNLQVGSALSRCSGSGTSVAHTSNSQKNETVPHGSGCCDAYRRDLVTSRRAKRGVEVCALLQTAARSHSTSADGLSTSTRGSAGAHHQRRESPFEHSWTVSISGDASHSKST